jgi:hypothetical protein
MPTTIHTATADDFGDDDRRGGTAVVQATEAGGVRLSVTHGGGGVVSYTTEYLTGLEMPPHLWRRVIRDVLAALPPEEGEHTAAAFGLATHEG